MSQYGQHRDAYIDFEESKFTQIFKQATHTQMPIERYTRTVFFNNQKFSVFDNVFVPRWETEGILQIAEEILDTHILKISDKPTKPKLKNSNKTSLKYIDICSGTGIIGISLLSKNKIFGADSKLLDICPIATENIQKNLIQYGLKHRVIQDDWFNYLISKNYEFITANFPYICINDPYDSNILMHDPKTALFAMNSGWEHYEKLFEFVEKNKFWQVIVCECSELHEDRWIKFKASYDQKSNDDSQEERKDRIDISLHKDFNDKFRFVSIVRLP